MESIMPPRSVLKALAWLIGLATVCSLFYFGMIYQPTHELLSTTSSVGGTKVTVKSTRVEHYLERGGYDTISLNAAKQTRRDYDFERVLFNCETGAVQRDSLFSYSDLTIPNGTELLGVGVKDSKTGVRLPDITFSHKEMYNKGMPTCGRDNGPLLTIQNKDLKGVTIVVQLLRGSAKQDHNHAGPTAVRAEVYGMDPSARVFAYPFTLSCQGFFPEEGQWLRWEQTTLIDDESSSLGIMVSDETHGRNWPVAPNQEDLEKVHLQTCA